MIDQPAVTVTRSKPRFALAPLSAAWRFRLLLGLVCIGAGILSIMLGPDNYWDLRYYHLYNPWAYLHHRYLYDVGPAQEQGFLNPTPDFLLYGLISSPLNDFPRVVAFIMGAVHGINAALLLSIVCQVLRPPQTVDRFALRAMAWLFGVSGSGFVSLLGTSTNDLTSALFVLGSLLGLLKVADRPAGRSSWKGFAAAGLWAGLGLGLKYTVAFVVPGLGVVALLVAVRKRTLIGLVVFGLAAALGVLIFAGHHMLALWEDFGNPLFPYMNQIFRSPYFEPTEIWDPRFIPDSFFKLMTFPFYWTRLNDYVVSEPRFRDWRAAIAYVAIVIGALWLIATWLRSHHLPKGLAQTPGLGLVLAFLIVSYFSWALEFGYYRYAIPLEMLTGVVTVGVLIWLFENRSLRLSAAAVVLMLAAATTVYLNWGRRPYTDKYVEVKVPPLPPNSIVLIATWDPAAYFIPFAEPSARYLGIENNYLQIGQNNKLATEVKRLMRTPGPPKYVLSVGSFDADKLNALLANFGLRLSPAPCAPIHSNLEDQALSLCRAE
ncbi:MAG TPA: glycosyltransferase family 39 protein [Xanthobacteraceae bacterium]|nr:glycosyltransferase family 39 protein [Xanthobacteraceae bacterium]